MSTPSSSTRSRAPKPASRGRARSLPFRPGPSHNAGTDAEAEASLPDQPTPRFDFASIAVRRPIQRKATVGVPGDPTERAAGEEEGTIHRKRAPSAGAGAALDTAAAVRAPGHGGEALPKATREFFEPRFGHDFSAVRVHAGAEATRGARAVEARAYTLGKDIVFGRGEYAPGTAEGTRLLAHELTHVVQQKNGVSLKGGIGQVGDAYERHADAVADAVVAGRSAGALLAQGPRGAGNAAGAAIQREEPGPKPAPAAGEKPAAAPPETEGDKMRRAILEAAERRLKEKATIVSAQGIRNIQLGITVYLMKLPDGTEVHLKLPDGVPMKNFSTCIEFAGQTFRDASKTFAGKGDKESRRVAALLPNILQTFNQEFELQSQIDLLQKSISRLVKPTADAEKRKADLGEKKEKLEARKTGEKGHDAGIDQAIKGQEHVIEQIEHAIAGFEKERQKFAAKVEKLKGDYAVLDAKGAALVRAGAPLSGHPKPGEYVLLGAGSSQAYGVKADTQVTLRKGAFKHISVFKSSEPAPSPKDKPNEKWERWHTIDGGGVEPRESKIYVCLSDLRVQFVDATNAWATSTTMLIGWIDMDKLVGGNDGAKKDGAASPAP
jgi:hypothetical protein